MSVEIEAVPTPGEAEYTSANIQHLQDADHIRKRPANYIPDASTRGLHHLVYELIYNAVDEHLAGFCKHVHVVIHPDMSLSVSDDGRGIPVDMHPESNLPTLEVVLTKVGAGGKFDNNAYKVSAGLHGVGAKAVTALSELTRAEIRRGGRVHVQEFVRGKATTRVVDAGAADRTGTRITFWPDREIFGDATFDYDTLEERLRELAFLNRGLSINFRDERINKETHFLYEGGVSEFVAWLDRNETVMHPPIHIVKEVGQVRVEVAFQYTAEGDEERVRCYANNQYNPNGGTHHSGFRGALTRTINSYAEKEKAYKDDIKPEGKDFREGLTGVINISLPNPQFETNTKIRLNNPEIEGIVQSAVSEVLAKYLEENPNEAKLIIKKVTSAAEMRIAMAKTREALMKRKGLLSGGGLPGKLMDCTSRHRDETELFLVEGDSAGGSAESGRDRNYQAVLPLRGKVLNVEKARDEKLLQNKEIASLIAAIGVDINRDGENDIAKVRYGKIIILTDADVDGQHIRTLLLTFFFRQMRKLIEGGHIYVARPPLYKVTQKKNVRFIQTGDEMTGELNRRGLDGTILRAGDRTFENERLQDLLDTLDRLEGSLNILERRGVNLNTYVLNATDQGLPAWHVKVGTKETWFHHREEADQFREAESKRLGRELVVAVADEASESTAETQFVADEFHEVHAINRGLAKLKEVGFNATDLVPPVRIAGREPPIRYSIEHGDSKHNLVHLRDLALQVRRIGERGLTITRFKGLGEMNPDELWETTLDPKVRRLLQVSLVDAQRANDLFRTLMGEEVEERRNFIFEKGINVKDAIDYGA